MHKLKRGVLVSLEGIDGAGKSTLINLLSTYLDQAQIDHIKTREPGGSLLGKQLSTMLHTNDFSICPKAEYLLFAADRAQHMHDLVLPALAQNKLVLSDRMDDSSVAYQGYGRGVDKEKITLINAWTMENYQPDIIFFIQVPVDIATKRIKSRGNQSQFEKKAAFLEQVEKGFIALFATKKNVIYIDGTQDTPSVAKQVYGHLKDWLCSHNL